MKDIFKSIVLITFLILLAISYYIYKTNTYITAEFKDLRPFHEHAPIYYNGFKIGKVVNIKPNKNYSATIVTMELHPDDLRLPINIVANLKKEKDKRDKKFDYIDIIMPEKPSQFFIKDGDRIAGKTTVELETFLANQKPETLEQIKNDMGESVKNLNITIQTLTELFATLNSMAEDVKPNVVNASSDLEKSTKNFVKISENIDVSTQNLNNAFDEKRLNNTAKNTQAVTKNVKVITSEIIKTVPNLNCTIEEANKVLCNLEEMTSGLNCTMKKPFGGFRLFFGKPISECGCK